MHITTKHTIKIKKKLILPLSEEQINNEVKYNLKSRMRT